ncbi:MAG TPA: YdcF family protein [Spirochaetia bacterium]|nr:YdcF family protein [Spirochaetia bacterium]
MKRLKLVTFLAAALILVLLIKNAGSFLVINEPPQKADVIIVLSGDTGGRLQRGIDLYRQGYAPYLLFTSSPTGLQKTQAMAEGVPAQAIILDPQAQNTYQNATYSKALMEHYGLKSAIVVSSDYHMRRASLIFAHVFKGTGTVFTYVSVKDPGFHPVRWWTSRQTILQMCWQYWGIVVFYLGLGPYITSAWIWDSPLKYLFRYMS